jgi:hypothetical protein
LSPKGPAWAAGRKSLGNTLWGAGVAFNSLRQSKQQAIKSELLDSYDATYNTKRTIKID